MEDDRGAATVLHRAKVLELALRLAAYEGLGPERSVAGDFDHQAIGQGVNDRKTDAVQAARGLIGVATKFPAGMQGREDHLQGRAILEFGVRIDRNAASVVADRDRLVGGEFKLDAIGVPGDRLVHGVIEDLCRQVVQGALVSATDIHTRPAANGFQAFQDLDIAGVVGPTTLRCRRFFKEILHDCILRSVVSPNKHDRVLLMLILSIY